MPFLVENIFIQQRNHKMDAMRGNHSGPNGLNGPRSFRNRAAWSVNTGKTIAIMRHSSLANYSTREHITISDFRYVASYNFLKTKLPAIMVPGSPPIWSPPPMPINIDPDVNQTAVGNAEDQTQRSIAPIFAALSASIDDTSTLRSTNLITDRNSLRKLFDFVNGKVPNGNLWKINVEMVRDTMVLSQNIEGIDRNYFGGYGNSFEKAFLKYSDDLKECREHNRVATYAIGGMRWMVGFEVDGCYGVQDTQGFPHSLQILSFDQTIENSQSPRLDQTIGSLQGSNQGPTIEETNCQGFRVIKTGTAISNLPILEVKTVKLGRDAKQVNWMPQLYFSQTSHLVIAKYDDGTFEEAHIEKFDKTEAMQKWEEENQVKLQKLLHLLGKIKDEVSGMQGRKGVLLCRWHSKIDILEQRSQGLALEESLVTQLWGPPAA